MHVDAAGRLSTGEVDEEPAREDRGRLGLVRVDALLPAVRAVGTQREALGRLQDPDRLEVRGLEQDVGRRIGDLAVLTAHDRRQRNRLRAVGDDEVALVERAPDAVERPELLARTRSAHDDAASIERRPGRRRAEGCRRRA